ncbi:GNAT family N-acetyltransferase [Pseudorhodoferax sp. LjRoot39]|uniref:GNAT family N-acetyltransferase n=1 Tax=Pseudorhodoferax sp. LjRoot39 TaxID=3342328 RepID=UPI003ECF01FC
MSTPPPATGTSGASAEAQGAVLVVRSAGTGDAARLATLATQVWLHTYAIDGIDDDIARHVLSELGMERHAALLGDPGVRVLVAELAGRLVGMAVLRIGAQDPVGAASTAELQTLYVQAHFVGRGIGTRLLQAAEGLARSQAGCALWLTVNARNARALAFYAHQGYRRVGTDWFTLGEARHENHVLLGGGLAGRPAGRYSGSA